jgi:hypothetical protein
VRADVIKNSENAVVVVVVVVGLFHFHSVDGELLAKDWGRGSLPFCVYLLKKRLLPL